MVRLMRGFMDKINIYLQILVNLNIISVLIISLYKRWIFNKRAAAVRDFARFLDQQDSSIKLYDIEQQAKRNALDKIILSGLYYENKK